LIAYYVGIKKRDSKYAFPLLLLFAIPFFTSYILRTLSWFTVLGNRGIINIVLQVLGIIDEPIGWLLYSQFAVNISLFATYIPFMIFPTWLAMTRIDDDLLRASADLGARPVQTTRYIILPVVTPGILIGAVFVFVGVLGESAVPVILGGGNVPMIGTTIDSAVGGLNLPIASAMSTTILFVAVIILIGWERLFSLKTIGEI